MEMLDKMKEIAIMIRDSADCAIGYQSAIEVLEGLETFASEYESHIRAHECPQNVGQKVPCVTLCPAHVDIPGYIALVRAGRYNDAVRLIRKDNPFPTVCGYVCEHPCEAHCRRSMVDDAVNICGIKRFACDHADNTTPPDSAPSTGKRIGIIGGGQLGRMFAQAAATMGYHVAVLEPGKACPAGEVSREQIETKYDDVAGLAALAGRVKAVTTEFENVPAPSLEYLEKAGLRVCPPSAAVAVTQDLSLIHI